MTNPSNVDLEQLLEQPDTAMQRLLSDLNMVFDAPMPDQTRAEIGRNLEAAARRAPPRRGLLRRRAACMAAALLVAAGALGLNKLQSPTPVSAADALRRAAAALSNIPAGDVVHEVTQMYLTVSDQPPPNDDLTYEQWTQVDGDGEPLQIDQVARSPNPALDERMVADSGGNLWTYRSSADVVTRSTWTPGKPMFSGPSPTDPQAIIFLPKEMMDAPQDSNTMRDLLDAATRGSDGQMRLLQGQTIDGHAVDVVQVTRTVADAISPFPPGWTSEVYTIDLDASSYLVRRIDVKGVNARGATVYEQTFDVTTYDIVPVSDVPAGTFTFTPAPGTKVCSPLDSGAGPGASPTCTTVK